MKLLSQTLSGVSLEDILKKKYPDIHFEIIPEPALQATTFHLTTKDNEGKKVGIAIRITRDAMEMGPQILGLTMKDAVRKLREYRNADILLGNNPSSRRFG